MMPIFLLESDGRFHATPHNQLADDPRHGSPYQGYCYAYPHKTAYRPFPQPILLKDLWASENRNSLCLYLHVPFCEMRCGFCNLFTQAQPKQGLTGRYLAVLRRQAERVREALGVAEFARLAIGGGTPTFLDVDELCDLFDIAENVMDVPPGSVPASVETSPATAEPEKLGLLRAHGVNRVSIGVQSFIEAETAAVARPQKTAEVEAALGNIRQAGFPMLNIDLIYGLPGQTSATWRQSLRQALRYQPEELYLYPLYVRPLTTLGRSRRAWDDERLTLYRLGRDLLLDAGYEQVSMRMFRVVPRLAGKQGHAADRRSAGVWDGLQNLPTARPIYCCQTDGMIGLGCGARSYTRSVHYSTEYAVGAVGIREILGRYLERTAESFDAAAYGFRLDPEEQRRRFVIQSLLQREGLSFDAYRKQFKSDACRDLTELPRLEWLGLARRCGTDFESLLKLTDTGLERSDAIGPRLYSSRVRTLMEEYEPR
jgi:oxygen-independent coproporphyrinogen-3 oxidase